VLQSHYRAPNELGTDNLEAAEEALRRIDALARRLAEADSVVPAEGVADQLTADFRTHMDDDLATPQALAALFAGVTAANSAFDRGDGPGGVAFASAALGGFKAVGLVADVSAPAPEDVTELARRRDEARAGRDWAAADQLRDDIVARGYRIEDTPGGTRVYR
jgi:cysteinyl-tRNA synthetase